MNDKPVAYIGVSGAQLNAYAQTNFTEEDVREVLRVRGLKQSGNRKLSIQAEEEYEDGTKNTFNINFFPEENVIVVQTFDTIDMSNIGWYINDLLPDIVNESDPEKQIVANYQLSYDHPCITFDLLANVFDVEEFKYDEETGTEYFIHEYNGIKYRHHENQMLFPTEVSTENILEFVEYANKQLYESLPETPEQFNIPELPNGWFNPVLSEYPNAAKINPETFFDNPEKLTEETDMTINAVITMTLDVMSAALSGLNTLTPEQREKYYDTYKDANEHSLFHHVLLDDSEEKTLLEKNEFMYEELWDTQQAMQLNEQKHTLFEFDMIADTYDDYEINTGDQLTMHSPTAHVWLTVEAQEKRQLDSEEFPLPHRPLWIGEVTDMGTGHSGGVPSEAEESIGDTIIIRANQLKTEQDELNTEL